MGWGFIGDIADAVESGAKKVGGAIKDAAEETVEAAGDAASEVGDTLGAAGSAVNWATGGAAGKFMEVVDDVAFDTVEWATDGAVKVDWDGGNFSAKIDVAGYGAGASIGEDGVMTESNMILASGKFGMTDAGLEYGGEAGVKIYPLPYAKGHMTVSPNGDISVNGEVQGTIPTPYGVLSGQANGGFVKTDQGWGAYVDADGTLQLPSGTTIGGGLAVAYQEDAEGNNAFNVSGHGEVSMPGMGTIGGSAGYERIEQDGNVMERGYGEGHAEGFGMSAGARADYMGITTDEGTLSQWKTDMNFEGFDAESIGQLSKALLGEDVGGITDGALKMLMNEAASSGDIANVVSGLDPAAKAALVERLAAPPDAADDVLMTGGMGTHAPATTTAGATDYGAPADPFTTTADQFDANTVSYDAPAADPMLEDPLAATPPVEDAPVDEFTSSIAMADSIEDSLGSLSTDDPTFE